jgi:hypothetical protein
MAFLAAFGAQVGGQTGQSSTPPQPSSAPEIAVVQLQVRGAQQLPFVKHTALPGQVPQSSGPPHALPPGALPQERCRSWHVCGAQQLPSEQTWPPGHVPHSSKLPQPSLCSPQCLSRLSQVRAWQTSHTLAVPAPAHVSPPVQPAPQGRVPPQPSPTVPQLADGLTAAQFGAGVQQAPE